MNQDALISVIVPVYNVEKYLDCCIHSIVDQTYKNLEIILVDDGSPDNCPAMCDDWAAKDNRIRVVHKDNGGGGDARNVGMDIARGDFISLIDSDDYIEPHMYEHLLSLMTDDVDIAECGILETESDCAALDNGQGSQIQYYATQDALRFHIADTIFRQTPPNKLYRRNTIGEIRFPVGMRIDDEFWTYRVIANARRLAHSFCNMYAYRQQSGSVMHLSFAPARLQALDAKCRRLDFLRDNFPELVPLATVNLWYTSLYMGQMALLHMAKENRKAAFEKIYTVRKIYPLAPEDVRDLPMKQRLWAVISNRSFVAACWLRNYLKIGI